MLSLGDASVTEGEVAEAMQMAHPKTIAHHLSRTGQRLGHFCHRCRNPRHECLEICGASGIEAVSDRWDRLCSLFWNHGWSRTKNADQSISRPFLVHAKRAAAQPPHIRRSKTGIGMIWQNTKAAIPIPNSSNNCWMQASPSEHD